MANRSVKIDIKFPSKNDANKQLSTLIEQLNKQASGLKIDLDFSKATKSFKEFSDALTKVGRQLSTFGTLDRANNDGVITKELKNINKLASEEEKVAKERINLAKMIAKEEVDARESSQAKIKKQFEDIINLQSKLNVSKSNGFIDDSVLNNLQKRLDSINVDTPKNEFLELTKIINNLGSSDGNVVRLQNTISKLENNMAKLKGKYNNLVGDKDSVNQVTAYDKALEDLHITLNDITKNGKVVDGKRISSEINTANNSFRTLETSVKNSSNALKITQKDAMSLGDSFKRMTQNMGIYLSTAIVLNEFSNQMKSATKYVIELDSAMTNLKKVTDENDTTYRKFLETAHEMSMEFGTQSNQVVDAVTSWSKTGKTLQEATKLAESTMLLTKVGDIENVAKAQEYMIAPLKAFNIEASKSISLVDKYNNLSNNMAVTSIDLGEALNRSASSMSLAGNTLDETVALISVAQSATQAGGDVVGQALKTLSMRINTFKDDETGEVFPTLADDLAKVGVQATDTAGQMRSTYDILLDLSKVWNSGSIDKNTQMALLEKLAGKRQANILGAILSDSKELERAFNLASNSANSAMKEFETYQESIQYSVDRLKEQMNSLYSNMINDSFLKGLTEFGVGTLGAVNKLVDGFGLLPTVVAIAGTSFLMFNKNAKSTVDILLNNTKGIGTFKTSLETLDNALSKQVLSIKENIRLQTAWANNNKVTGASTQGLGASLVGLNVKLVATEAKLIATKFAIAGLQTAASLGLSMAITGAITLLTKLGDSVINAKSNLKEFNDEFINSNENNNTNSAQKLIDKYKSLSDQLKVTATNTEEYKTKEQELKATLDELIQIYPNAKTKIDEETGAKLLNVDATQKAIDANIELAKSQANKVLDENDMYSVTSAEKLVQNYEDAKKKLEELNNLAANGVETTSVNGVQRSIQGEIDRTSEKFSQYESAIRASLPALKLMSEENSSLTDVYDVLEGAIGDTSNELDNGTGSIDGYSDSLNGLQTEIISTTDQLKNMADEFGNLGNDIDILSKALDEFGENGIISADSMEKLLNTGDTELIALLADENTFLEKGNELLSQKKTLRDEAMNSAIDLAYNEINAKDTETQNFINNENAKIDATNNTNKSVVDSTANATNVNKNNYNIDLDNKITTENEKAKSVGNFVNANADATANMVNQLGGHYGTDVKNFENSLNSKIDLLNTWGAKVGDYTIGSRAGMSESKDPTYDITKDILYQQKELGKVQAAYNQLYASANKVGIGDIGSGGTGSSGGSSATEKQQEDIENLADRYYELQNALTDVENALKSLDIKMENASEEEKIKLLDQEIALLAKKKKALNDILKEQKKEKEDLKSQLANNGFTFDDAGNIKNYQEQMRKLQAESNKLTDAEAKKSAQETYKNLAKIVDEYTKLVKDSIPDTIAQFDDIENAIIESQKNIADILQKQKEDYIENLESETNKLKDELQKRKVINASYVQKCA